MITATAKISTEKEIQSAMIDTLKNPPKTPMESFLWMSKYVNLSSDFGKTVIGLIPGAGSIIGSLMDIFSAFSSGPSLGEVVLDGLNSLSNQIAELQKELTSTIEKTANIQTEKTVNFVLQGIDEMQQEVSASQVMQALIEQDTLEKAAKIKIDAYSEFLQNMDLEQKKIYADINSVIDRCQKELNDLYESIKAKFGSMGFDLFGYFQQLSSDTITGTQKSTPIVRNAVITENKTSTESGFNLLYLSPLLLLLFMKKKK